MITNILSFLVAITMMSCNSPFSHAEKNSEASKCAAVWYSDPSENQRCYSLQEQLSDAAIADDIPGMEGALTQGANVNGGYYQSLPVLEAAASKGHTGAVRFLIDNGANTNRVRPLGQTALKSAVYYRQKETVKTLLEKGADVCEKTETTALEYAVKSGDSEMVKLLVVAGADDCR